jgi:hypothetical protein
MNCKHKYERRNGDVYCIARGTAYCSLPYRSPFYIGEDDCKQYVEKKELVKNYTEQYHSNGGRPKSVRDN